MLLISHVKEDRIKPPSSINTSQPCISDQCLPVCTIIHYYTLHYGLIILAMVYSVAPSGPFNVACTIIIQTIYTQTPLIRTPLIRARLSTGRDLTRREQGQTASIRPRLLARGGDWFQRRGIYRRDIHSVGEPSPLLLPQAPTTAQDQVQVHIYTYWDTTVY